MKRIFLTLAALAMIVTAARADYSALRFDFAVDSTTVTMSTSRDVVSAFPINTSNLPSNVTASMDTSFALTAAGHSRKSLAVVVEVTGTMQSTDSLYLSYDVSEDNSRFFAGLSSYISAVETTTGSQTFVFLLPSDPQNPLSWIWHEFIRFHLQGDTNAASRCFATRWGYSIRTR